ncbi:hypothetical protein C8R43DRAFT_42756 [Mycena crocata]|nr:hypothetical protein C8R43DRAFT_42756 [Mycena crocata]
MAHKSPAMKFFDLTMGPHDALFAQIPARELVRLMLTCRRVYFLVQDTCFNLTRLLSPFFGDAAEVERFRWIQAQTATVISGSIALQYFNRMTWPDSDMDMYTDRSSAVTPVQFIISNGYTFDPRLSQKKDVFAQLSESVKDRPVSYLGRGIADVLDFHKGDKKIQLIIATSTPMEVILSFHSTPVMNILTHNKAHALYPRSTFETKKALVIETVGAGQEAGRQKYVNRGWDMISDASVSSKSELGVRMVRSVGDTFTWTLPLPPLRNSVFAAIPDLSPINSWQLACDGETTWTDWHVLEHPGLQYQYIVAGNEALMAVSDEVLAKATEFPIDACLCRAISRHYRHSRA